MAHVFIKLTQVKPTIRIVRADGALVGGLFHPLVGRAGGPGAGGGRQRRGRGTVGLVEVPAPAGQRVELGGGGAGRFQFVLSMGRRTTGVGHQNGGPGRGVAKLLVPAGW